MRDLFQDRVGRLIFVLALVIRAAFALEVRAHDLDLSSNKTLDMIFMQKNAEKIAAGDVRLVEPYLGSYSDVPGIVYGAERYERLFGKHTYFDSPGYLYFAAMCETLGPRSPYSVLFVQCFLDALGCGFVYVLARRIYGLATARVALVAAALCLECVAYAGFLLRESSIAFLVTASVLALDSARRSGSGRSWALAGLVFGCGWVTKLTFSIFAPFVVVVAFVEPPRNRVPHRLGAFALGAALAIAPFAARNLSLGVPPLRMSTTALAAVVCKNMPGYQGCGEYFRHEETHSLLERSDETTFGAWLVAVRAFPDPRRDYTALLARKFHYFWLGVDFWDDIRVSYLKRLSPSLGLCVCEWGVLGPWTALGIAIGVASRKRRVAVVPLVGAFLALGLGAALAGGAITRYRMVIEPIACVFFAATVVDTAALIRSSARRWLGVALLAVAVSLHVLLKDPQAPLTRSALRDYVHTSWGSRPRAVSYLDDRAERSGAP